MPVRNIGLRYIIIILFLLFIIVPGFTEPCDKIMNRIGFNTRTGDLTLASFGLSVLSNDFEILNESSVLHAELFKINFIYENDSKFKIVTNPVRIDFLGKNYGKDEPELLFNLLSPLYLATELLKYNVEKDDHHIIDFFLIPSNLLNSEIRYYLFNNENMYFMIGNNGNIYFNTNRIEFRNTLHTGFTIQKKLGLMFTIEKNLIDLKEPYILKISITTNSDIYNMIMSV